HRSRRRDRRRRRTRPRWSDPTGGSRSAAQPVSRPIPSNATCRHYSRRASRLSEPPRSRSRRRRSAPAEAGAPGWAEPDGAGDATVAGITDATGLSTIIKMLVDVPEEVWRREVDADANGEVRLSYHVAHVRLGDASILIDLGFDDPSPTSPWKAPRHLRTPGV